MKIQDVDELKEKFHKLVQQANSFDDIGILYNVVSNLKRDIEQRILQLAKEELEK